MNGFKRVFNKLLLNLKKPKQIISISKQQPTDTCELEINSTIIIPHSNSNSHDYEIGREYVVYDVESDVAFKAKDPKTDCAGNVLIVHDVYIKHKNITKEELEEEKEKLECELGSIESKLKFMEENDLDEFDEDEYKIHRSLDVLEDDNKSREEKAKELNKLIKNKSCET